MAPAISFELRAAAQAKRVATQQAPDGAPYAARKQRKNLRGKKGRVKRQKAAMFEKIRLQKISKSSRTKISYRYASFDGAADRPRVPRGIDRQGHKKGPEYNYPIRPLLGFSPTDEALIRDSLLRHLGG
jgi:phage virion morphogenesis protein